MRLKRFSAACCFIVTLSLAMFSQAESVRAQSPESNSYSWAGDDDKATSVDGRFTEVFYAPDASTELLTPDVSTEVVPPDASVEASTFLAGPSQVDSCGKCKGVKGNCACICSVSVHRSGIFVEGLYLVPNNIDVVYAIEQTDPDPLVANPTGPVGRIAFDADMAIRGGFAHAFSDCASLQASYTWFETGTTDSINRTGTNVLHSRIIHPSTLTSGAASTQATASYDLQFQRADIDYRVLLVGDDNNALNFFGGVRYAALDEHFSSAQTIAVATGLTTVNTEIDIDAYGIGLGLDSVRRSPHTGLLVYGKAGASFLQGEFKADYLQTNQLGGGTVGDTLRDNRFLSILELELGLGWQNDCGNFRATTGYVASGWFNTITTDAYVQGFRAGVLEDLSETLTFGGLVGRIEYRY